MRMSSMLVGVASTCSAQRVLEARAHPEDDSVSDGCWHVRVGVVRVENR
jgi:hypothetical protein